MPVEPETVNLDVILERNKAYGLVTGAHVLIVPTSCVCGEPAPPPDPLRTGGTRTAHCI